MKKLNFSYTYDKLYALNEGYRATTIRRRNKFKKGEQVKVLTNGQFLCYARIEVIEKLKIKEIEDGDLIADVAPHTDTRKGAINFINRFYKIPLTEESEVFLYTLKRLPESQVIVKIQPILQGKCPACGFEAPLSEEEESQSILICDNCEAGFPGYMYVATKTTKLSGDET